MKRLEVIARVRDPIRFKPEPPDHLQNALEVSSLFRLWVGVIVSEITVSAVMGCIAEIDEDSFGVTDMQESVWFRWETSEDLPTCSGKVLLPKMGVNLGVPSRFVKLAEETFFENSPLCCFRRCGGGF